MEFENVVLENNYWADGILVWKTARRRPKGGLD